MLQAAESRNDITISQHPLDLRWHTGQDAPGGNSAVGVIERGAKRYDDVLAAGWRLFKEVNPITVY